MSEGNRFVVEVVGKLREAREVTVSRVSEALGLDEARAAALVARMPGVITKPVGEDRAMKIALRLQEAGVPALHRPLTEAEAPGPGQGASVARDAPETARGAVGERAFPGEHADPGEFALAGAPADAGEHASPGAPAEAADPDFSGAPAEAADPGVSGAPAAAADPDFPAAHADPGESVEPGAPVYPGEPVYPGDIPSVDATHHDFDERDAKLTPMSEAGFGAADIVLPTENVRDTQDRPRPRATFVEAGPTSMPNLTPVSPVLTTGPMPLGRGMTPALPPRGGTPAPSDRADTPVPPGRTATPVPPGRGVGAKAPRDGSGAPVYRQTKSSAEPPLTLSAPPDDVLKRSGVPEAELGGKRGRGRFGRHLAAQVALPGLLTWSLTAVALWWLLGEDRPEHFVLLAAATAVTALIGSLVAALGTVGIARDVVRLRDEARRVAMGELTSPVASNRDDELGELAGALERMRLSLQEGLERLRQRNR